MCKFNHYLIVISGKFMTIFKAAIIALILSGIAIETKAKDLEKYFQNRFCKDMKLEVYTRSKGFVDCVTDTYAIEVDFAKSWTAAIGQSLWYANELKKRAGIILVCREIDKCTSRFYLLGEVVDAFSLPITVWYCEAKDSNLSECKKIEN